MALTRTALERAIAIVPALLATPVWGRGFDHEPAPWYSADHQFSRELSQPDSTLNFSIGVCSVSGRNEAVIFPLALGTLRRGPLEFATRWSYVSVRRAGATTFGFGDPRVYARLRIPTSVTGRDSVEALRRRPVELFVELRASIPTAPAQLFPYASGGQDVAAYGVVAMPGWNALSLGGGRIWAEPPSGTDLDTEDVPRATHAWLQLQRGAGFALFSARADGFWFEIQNSARGVVSLAMSGSAGADLAWWGEWAFETAAEADRLFDHRLTLRFVTPLR